MDDGERLRLLALNDQRMAASLTGGLGREPHVLDARCVALVQLAGLVAVGGAVSSYGALADAAIGAGATAAEMVDVLVALVPLVGLPVVTAAAGKPALVLGHDPEESLAEPHGC